MTRSSGKMITIRDVARRAGVSVATVSNVLKGQKKVRNASFERVTEAARELNYRADPAAAWLRTGRSKVVAAVAPNFENPFFTAMIAAVERLCQQDGYELIVASSDGRPEIEDSRIAALLQWRPAAFLVLPCSDELVARDRLEAAGVPMVVADRGAEDGDWDFIALDNHQSGRLAAGHLCGLGHRHIAVFASSLAVGNIRARFEGVQAAIAEAGGPPPILIETQNMREEATPIALDPARLGAATGLIALTNFTTLQVLGALSREGLRVPADISLVGFDDLVWMSVASPSITAIRQPVTGMGEAVWSRLRAQMDGTSGPARHEKLPGELVIRESTAPPRRGS